MRQRLLIAGLGALALPAGAQAATPGASACAALRSAAIGWPEAGTRIASVAWRTAGPAPAAPAAGPPAVPLTLPAHCELVGVLHERTGVDGQHYAIRFHLRMPAEWNGRFFMMGGSGSNGELGDAVGRLNGGAAPALAQGYAVMSQDSGHDNAVNTVPAKSGASAFGFDPQARADYGGASLRPSVEAARAAVRAFYGERPKRSYFVGCSKGGQEGMMLATRYPDLFDGIVAAAPGFALPRAAIAEAWDTQALAGVVRAQKKPVTIANLASAFSAADLALVTQAVLAACDRDDGAADGIVADHARCTTLKVWPELAKVTCRSGKTGGCLSSAQVIALRRIREGARTPDGKRLYAGFPFDTGWAEMGWRVWKLGGGPAPSINVAMGAPSLAAIFTTPPTPLPDDPQAKLDWLLRFDFARDAARITATGGGFARSAWEDIGARSADLSAFRKRGGRLIVPHGVSDPVFSVDDTLDWYGEVQHATRGRAGSFARVFAVPGMNHCGGGPATDGIDTLAPLVAWVEKGKAPDALLGTAGPASPWPGRTRPICAWPKVARYRGTGSLEEADSFSCS